MPILRAAALAVSVVAVAIMPGRAQSLDELTTRGAINIGCLVDAPPYGMLNDHHQAEGYDIDVAKLLAKALGVTANIVPVTGPTRIPYLLTGKIDVDAACQVRSAHR